METQFPRELAGRIATTAAALDGVRSAIRDEINRAVEWRIRREKQRWPVS